MYLGITYILLRLENILFILLLLLLRLKNTQAHANPYKG